MRRGFGRRRRKVTTDRPSEIDLSELNKVSEWGLVEGDLSSIDVEGVPRNCAIFGETSGEGVAKTVVARAHSMGQAVGAALVAKKVLEVGGNPVEKFLAVGTELSRDDKLQLAGLGSLPENVTSHLVQGSQPIAIPSPDEPSPVPISWLTSRLTEPQKSLLTGRCVSGLSGLAAKYGGSVRAHGKTGELCICGRVLAVLSWENDALVLRTLLPQKAESEVQMDSLADVLDRLEGNIRKFVNDRRTREGNDGFRGRASMALAHHLGLRSAILWPLSGRVFDPIDAVGIGPEGGLVLCAVRQDFGFAEALSVVGGLVRVRELLPALFRSEFGPDFAQGLTLVLSARTYTESAEHLLAHLRFPVQYLSVNEGSGSHVEFLTKGESGGSPAPRDVPRPERRGRPRRNRERRPNAGRSVDPKVDEGQKRAEDREPLEERKLEEISLFDLDDERSEAKSTRRRRRGRKRADRAPERVEEEKNVIVSSSDTKVDTVVPETSQSAEPDVEVDEDGLPLVAPDPPDPAEAVEVKYEASELAEEPLTEAEQVRLERERRRLLRVAARPEFDNSAQESQGEIELSKEFRMPRGRAAILCGDNRGALLAAIVLGRDLRNLEGIWIYPEEEMMTFFRSVATDLSENTSFFVVGQRAKPAKDAIQAASLYRDRIVWLDHQAWLPEDEGGMREAIGSQSLCLTPGLDSPLSAVLSKCGRRSRFTDKLVDLATGRFSEHDFERWGRVWWDRLGDQAKRVGAVGTALDPLFAGRPSDLAREAAQDAIPELPPEVSFVSSRDFRLTHFGGFGLVSVEVPVHLDLHLTARVARERHDVPLSLVWHSGGEVLVLASNDTSAQRVFECGAMVEHLVEKFSWAEGLEDADHVARLRAVGLEDSPEKLDQILNEIAMGRSLLEG